MNSVISLDRFSPEQRQRLKTLTVAPPVAWFTLVVSIALFAGYVGTIALGVSGLLPLWLGCIVNGLIGFFAFTPLHEGVHRAVSQNQRLNDFVCTLGVLMTSPSADQRMFRWVHILHHRFGLGPKDPDRELKGPWWSLPFRWAFLDVIYLTYVMRNPSKVAKPYFRRTVLHTVVLLSIIVALCLTGYGMEVLLLWFIPTRITFFLISFAFLWLPHVPHTVSQEENYTQATTMRFGWEPLMRFLLQGHHYHLIHHLYPTAPFYNTEKIWKLIEPEARAHHDLAIQHRMGVFPSIHAAGTT